MLESIGPGGRIELIKSGNANADTGLCVFVRFQIDQCLLVHLLTGNRSCVTVTRLGWHPVLDDL